MAKFSALEVLLDSGKLTAKPVILLVGQELFLRTSVRQSLRKNLLPATDEQENWLQFDATEVDWDRIRRELETVPLFGSERQVVCVQEANRLLTRNKDELENYVQSPSEGAILVLEFDSLPQRARLVRLLGKNGYVIDCSPPRTSDVTAWLPKWASKTHGVQLTQEASRLLVDLVGEDCGVLDQEIARLALLAKRGGRITPNLIRQAAGHWRVRSTWDMLDAALAGRVQEALQLLERLLAAGENPIAIVAQIASSVRRLALAAQIMEIGRTAKRHIPIQVALEQAGVPTFFRQRAAEQLSRIGLREAQRLNLYLLEADQALKGFGGLSARLAVERLVVQLGVAASPK